MDIKAFRGLSGTYNVRANVRDRAAPRDIECLVYFLNNTQFKFTIDRRSKGQDLLDCVFKHLNLIETDFFGLKYLPQDPTANLNDTEANISSTKTNDSPSPLETVRFHSGTNPNSSSSNSSTNNKSNAYHNTLSNYHDSLYQNNNNNNSSLIREHHSPSSRNSCKTASPSPIPSKEQQNLIHNAGINHQHNHPHYLHHYNNNNQLHHHLHHHHHNQQHQRPPQRPCLSNSPATLITTSPAPETASVSSNNLASTVTLSTNSPLPIVDNNIPACTSSPVLLQNSSSSSAILTHGICSETNNSKRGSVNHIDSLNSGSIDNLEFIEERWLDPAKSIRKQYKSGPPYKFYFRVRFYVSDPAKLADDTTRTHLYLQLRQDILNDRLILPSDSAILLASYILQSEFGNYRDELIEINYASKIKLLPDENDDFRRKVIKLHKEHAGLSSADAEHQFLEHASKYLDCYGVEFYDAKDQFSKNVMIGVSSSGIVVFKDKKKMSQFSWAKIIKIMFKKKIFSIQLRRETEKGNCDNFIEFNLISNQACKSFWEECVAQHSFFRLHQPKSPPKKFFSFLNFGSKFQYNGKTEYQTMEESRKRSFSHFSRTLSKRYARRTLPIGKPPWANQMADCDPIKAQAGEFGTDSNAKAKKQNNRQQQLDNTSDSHSRISTISSSSSKSSNNVNNNSGPGIPRKSEYPATLAESIAKIKKGLEKKDLITQFEQLSRKKEDESHEESRLMENIDKNRYQDILPYDSTRVQLMDSMTGDYINASFVNVEVPNGMVNRYIATQGPLLSTCDDFWQMIWEQNCSLIIMVTPLIEAGRVKCHKYWPDEKEEVRHGQLLIRNLNEKSKTATIDRTIQVVDIKSGEKRNCVQIQYKAWPDHEVPEDCSDFLKLVNRVKKHRATQPEDPIVVHCSAGIGRTGVLILMETAICIMEAGEPIHPIQILQDMRRQRAMLIQTSSQFKFVTEAICKVYDQKLYKKRSKKSRRK